MTKRQTSIRSALQCIFLIAIASGCSNFERSQYHSGPADKDTGANLNPPVDDGGNDGSGTEPNDSQPTDPVDPTPDGAGPDLTFDTGLPRCLKEHIETTFGRYAAPLILSQTLGDFEQAPVTGLADFETLADLILRRVVNTAGLVDYSVLRGDLSVQWSKLMTSLQTLAAPVGADTTSAIAFWINAYNLVMIDYIVNAPEARDVGQDLGFGIFDAKRQIAGTSLSLNDIEFGILALNGSPNAVPRDLQIPEPEYRVHVAVVCGALSCPKLRNFLYRPADLELLLTENTLLVANSPDFFAADGNTLVHSGLFNFYPDDFAKIFGDRSASLPDYLVSTCREDAEQLRSLAGTNRRRATPYDWTINRQ